MSPLVVFGFNQSQIGQHFLKMCVPFSKASKKCKSLLNVQATYAAFHLCH